MDAVHEAHLARILENRRRRGVLLVHPPTPGSRRGSRGPSAGTQTEASPTIEAGTSPAPTSRAVQTSTLAEPRNIVNETDNNFVNSRDAGVGEEPEAHVNSGGGIRGGGNGVPSSGGSGGRGSGANGAGTRPSLWRSPTAEEPRGSRWADYSGLSSIRNPMDSPGRYSGGGGGGRGASYRSRPITTYGRPITEFGVLYSSPDVVPPLRYSTGRASNYITNNYASLDRLPRWSPPRDTYISPLRSSPYRFSSPARSSPYRWSAPARSPYRSSIPLLSWRSSSPFYYQGTSSTYQPAPRANSPENVLWTDRKSGSRSPSHPPSPRRRGSPQQRRRQSPSQGRNGRSPASRGRRSPRQGSPHYDPYGPPTRNANPVATSVIYTGDPNPEQNPPPRRRAGRKQPLVPPPPPQVHRPQWKKQALGLPDLRSTIDLRTSVQIVAQGDWFYKWNQSGTSVFPRWVWVDTKSYLLVWSHKETHDPTFSSSMRLEQITQVTPREIVQMDDQGLPHSYYVLMVDSNKRVLQIATERKDKADVWFEALNNILAFVRRDDVARGTLRAD